MRLWLRTLKADPDSWEDFTKHLTELAQKHLNEEHCAKDWPEVRECRGKKKAIDRLLTLAIQEEREEQNITEYKQKDGR